VSEILNGWKAIAEFLGVHEETAKVWENKYSLPISRPAGRVVMATREDLTRWVKECSAGNR
jgi:hypothetical protein